MPEIMLRGGPCNGQKFDINDPQPIFWAPYDASPFASFTQAVEGMPPQSKMERAKYVRFSDTFEYIWEEAGAVEPEQRKPLNIKAIVAVVAELTMAALVSLASVCGIMAITVHPGQFHISLGFSAILCALLAIYLAVQ